MPSAGAFGAVMKRYYFDIRDGDEVAVDKEGLELPAIGHVQAEAARALADLATDVVQNDFRAGAARVLAIEVRDTRAASPFHLRVGSDLARECRPPSAYIMKNTTKIAPTIKISVAMDRISTQSYRAMKQCRLVSR